MQAPYDYRTVLSAASAEITEKNSRFIGDIFPVTTEAQAQARITEVQKKYHDARHHCFGYILGSDGAFQRASDNGEPQGTAGRPILRVLTGARLTDALIVVTRYFGGTLLGTGGLTRAYTQAAQEACARADFVTYTMGRTISFTSDYAHVATVLHYFREKQLDPGAPVYEENVRFEVFVPEAHVALCINDLTNIFNGNIDISESNPLYLPIPS